MTPRMSPAGPTPYVAFLSYRHAEEDRRWASWLLKRIETYRVPRRLAREAGAPRRLGRVFRDEEELSATADLSATIREALSSSRFLVVICSPRTPASAWVNREVETFRDAGRGDRVLAFLVEGEPDESFPPALRTLVPAAPMGMPPAPAAPPLLVGAGPEPLAADARPRHGLSARQARHTARRRVLARLIGCRYDDLRQRDAARRQRRWVAATLVGAVLAAAMLLLALVAVSERDTARIERDRARALGLVQASVEAGPRDPMRALLLAREGVAAAEGPATRTQLRRALAGVSVRGVAFDGEDHGEALVMSPAGDRVVAVRRKGRALFLDERARTLAALADLPTPCAPAFAADGAYAVLLGPGGSLVRIARDGTVTRSAPDPAAGEAHDLALDGDVAWALAGRTVRRVLLSTLEVTATLPLQTDGALSIVPVPGTSDVVVGFQDGTLLRSDGTAGFRELARQPSPAAQLRWQVPGAVLLAGGTYQRWTRHDLAPGGARKPLEFDADRVAVAPRRGVRAVYEIGSLTLLDADDRKVASLPLPSLNTLVADATSTDFLAVTGTGELHVVSSDGVARRLLPGRSEKTWEAACARGASALVLETGTSRLEMHDVSPGDLGCYGTPGGGDARSPWSPDGATFLSVEGSLVVVRDRDGAARRVLRGPSAAVTVAAFSPDGTRIVAGDEGGRVTTWRPDGSEARTFSAHTGPVHAVGFDPARPGRLVTSGADRTAAIWAGDEAPLARLRGHRDDVLLLAISDDGARILTSDGLDAARVWDGDGRPLLLLPFPDEPVSAAGFLEGGRTVALIGETLARVYDAEGRLLLAHAHPGGSEPAGLFGPRPRAGDGPRRRAAAITPSGQLALFGPRLRLVDAAGRDRVGAPRAVRDAGFALDEGRAVTWDTGLSAELWTLGADRGLRLGGHGAPLSACTFGLVGGRFATGATDGSIQVRDAGGALLESIPGADSAVRALRPSPDGRRLLAADASGRMRLLLVDPAEVLALARSRSLRALDDAERATYAGLLGSPGPDARPELLRQAARTLDEAFSAELRPDDGTSHPPNERRLQEVVETLYPGAGLQRGLALLMDELTGLDPALGRRLDDRGRTVNAVAATRRKLAHLRELLEAFRRRVGRHPTAEEGILALDPGGRALTAGEVGASPVLDGWGALFLYAPEGSGFSLSSAGPDGRHGTEDDVR